MHAFDAATAQLRPLLNLIFNKDHETEKGNPTDCAFSPDMEDTQPSETLNAEAQSLKTRAEKAYDDSGFNP
ncbi:MAG: hypothetical protein ABW034_15650, partial [Steroidobacteraceae bacterium]